MRGFDARQHGGARYHGGPPAAAPAQGVDEAQLTALLDAVVAAAHGGRAQNALAALRDLARFPSTEAPVPVPARPLGALVSCLYAGDASAVATALRAAACLATTPSLDAEYDFGSGAPPAPPSSGRIDGAGERGWGGGRPRTRA
jgi:hypothetical protein